MNEFTKAERLAAIALNGAAQAFVETYAKPADLVAAKIAALSLAIDMAKTFIDLSVVSELDYPDGA